MARPAQSHDNTEVRQYLIDKLQMDYGFRYELPGWLDDVLTGAGRLNGSLRSNTKPVSKRVILSMLMAHDIITAEAIRYSLSHRKMALEGTMISERYARHVASVVAAASRSIQHYRRVQVGMNLEVNAAA
ncbi:TPA: hypothetical protein PXP81_004383 [Yersinia enterocolitica]|nr:hypothetical protein [Yersinia enterocolitica]HDL7920826.1 hypothetical protein [Yersinia enterocolitica]HDL7933818.1 hypothetical protein [Yersinia enterocolitica]